MDDLMSKLQSILSTKEGQDQLKNIQSMFNNSGNKQAENAPPQNGGFDISSLASMLSSMGGASAPQEQAKPADNANGNGFDVSSIMSILSGLGGGSSGGSGSASGGGSNNEAASGMPNIDIDMIMKLQKVFSSMNISDKNSQLLLALKPHFSEQRSKKVDQAISMMRLVSMMPMLKESGIFSGL